MLSLKYEKTIWLQKTGGRIYSVFVLYRSKQHMDLYEKSCRNLLRQLFCVCMSCIMSMDYSWLIAPVGQAPAHVPHSTQASASITYWLSPAEIAPTGHCPSQVPQLTQESEITYAIIMFLLKIKTYKCSKRIRPLI